MDSNKLKRMGRRRFIRTASLLGISATTLKYGSQTAIADKIDDNEIPYISRIKRDNSDIKNKKKDNNIYKTINKNEFIRKKTAIDVRDKIGKRLDKRGFDAVNVLFCNSDNSNTGFEVKVIISNSSDIDKNSLIEIIPQQKKGKVDIQGTIEMRKVPIHIEYRDINTLSCSSDMTDNYWEEVYAGVPIIMRQKEDGSCYLRRVSSCAPYYHPVHGEGMISTGHSGTPSCDDFHVYKGRAENESYRIGQIRAIVNEGGDDDTDAPSNGLDWSYLTMEDFDAEPNTHVSTVEEYENSDIPIKGIITNDSLIADINYDEPYYTQGRNSGRQEQNILGLTYDNNTVLTDNLGCDGDSGGILYKNLNSKAFVSGTIYANTAYLQSTTAETIENDFGGYFMSN